MKKNVAPYIKKGFTVSRRASISYQKNELPLSHWMELLRVNKAVLKNLLVYCGDHQTGLYARRTKFYRLPRLDDEKEFNDFFRLFHSIPPDRKKCIDYMANHLQEEIKPALLKPKTELQFQQKNNYVKLADLFSPDKNLNISNHRVKK